MKNKLYLKKAYLPYMQKLKKTFKRKIKFKILIN